MESLYTKYRPQTFQDVVGQQVVVSTLENAVLEGRTGHAYLFCGPRGTGKTTMARLLAKALMCEHGPNQLPDGTCEQCRLIAAGEHPDVYELDAASRTGVDNVRDEIISRVNYAPVRGRYKVYIIDEVHMLTTAAFNALLKTLEEPPDHVVFILCTTDPQKIPATIISRVQRFDFHAISNDEIRQRLAYVCQQEGFSYDDEALDLVVRHARGGMRDALSTLEQLSVFGNGSITLDAAQDMLGSVPGSTLGKVCDAMARRDVATLYQQVATLVDGGRDLLQFVRELAAHVRDLYVVSAVGPREGVVTGSKEELDRLAGEARAFGSADRVAHVLAVLGDVSNEMRTATNQRLSLEIAFTRIARPESDLTLESLADRVATLEAELAELREKGVTAAPAALSAAAASGPSASGGAAFREVGQGPAAREMTSAAIQTDGAHAPARAHGERVAPGQTSAAVQQPEGVASPQPGRSSAGGTQVAGQRSVASGARPAQAGQPMPAASAYVRPAQSARPAPPAPDHAANRAPAAPGGSARPAPAASRGGAGAAPPTATPAAGNAITDPGELQRLWKRSIDTLIKRVPSRGSLLMSSSIVSDDGTTLSVSLPKGSTFALKMLERADVLQAIEPPIAQVFGGSRSLRFFEGEPPARQPRRQTAPSGGATPSRRTAAAVGDAAGGRQPAPTRGADVATAAGPARGTPAAPGQGTQGMGAPASAASQTGAPGARRQPQAPARSQATSYPMPWDPAPTPAVPQTTVPVSDEPPYEEVPYGDADAMSYDEPFYGDAPAASSPSAASASAVAAGFASQGASERQAMAGRAPVGRGPVGQQRAQAASAASPAMPGDSSVGQRPVSRVQAGQTQTSQGSGGQAPAGASPVSSATPSSAGAEAPTTFDASTIPDDIPDDLRSVIEDCFEVFGDGVKVSSVQAAPTQDEAEALAESGATPSPSSDNDSDALGDGFVDDAENGSDEDDDG